MYELQVERRARKDLLRVPRSDYHRLEGAIDGLARQPRPRGAKKLRGAGPIYRIRIGEYRVLYGVFDRERLVKVLRLSGVQPRAMERALRRR